MIFLYVCLIQPPTVLPLGYETSSGQIRDGVRMLGVVCRKRLIDRARVRHRRSLTLVLRRHRSRRQQQQQQQQMRRRRRGLSPRARCASTQYCLTANNDSYYQRSRATCRRDSPRLPPSRCVRESSVHVCTSASLVVMMQHIQSPGSTALMSALLGRIIARTVTD